MLSTTLRKLREIRLRENRFRLIAEKNPGLRDDDPLPFWRILETNGVSDALWVFRGILPEQLDEARKVAVSFAVACAERAAIYFEIEYPSDTRPRAAVEAARRVAGGDYSERAKQAAHESANEAWNAATVAALTAMTSPRSATKNAARFLFSFASAAQSTAHAADAAHNVSSVSCAAYLASLSAIHALRGAPTRGEFRKIREEEKSWQRETLAKLLKNKGEENEDKTIH